MVQKLKKGDYFKIYLDVTFRCLNHESVEIDLDDLKNYLKEAVDLYKAERGL